ncbi:chloride channel protein [Pseudenhygromyxa sp. WMMC2535]|uniref:chloride channel protein n=1 Tax=Pseudenhygromyxa sp. WMMC2535 TaxID=2712867 RepID=UPI0015959A1A|nr:chloride channel protein [Pseudenhygromyxa sp. WMMC2535]NVB38478.1 chloride channel protein [Pseudenhygromyxa sp. WMMC2535]
MAGDDERERGSGDEGAPTDSTARPDEPTTPDADPRPGVPQSIAPGDTEAMRVLAPKPEPEPEPEQPARTTREPIRRETLTLGLELPPRAGGEVIPKPRAGSGASQAPSVGGPPAAPKAATAPKVGGPPAAPKAAAAPKVGGPPAAPKAAAAPKVGGPPAAPKAAAAPKVGGPPAAPKAAAAPKVGGPPAAPKAAAAPKAGGPPAVAAPSLAEAPLPAAAEADVPASEPSGVEPILEPEPSLELNIELEEVGARPGSIDSTQHSKAAGAYRVGAPVKPAEADEGAEAEDGPRRKRHVAGVHPSLAGVPLLEDSGVYPLDEAAALAGGEAAALAGGEAAASTTPAAPVKPASSAKPAAEAGSPPRRQRKRRPLRTLANAALRTGVHVGLLPAQAEQKAWDPSKTGFHKPLPTTGRIARLWEGVGLRMGQRFASAVGDDHLYLLVMAVIVGVASGATAGLLLLWIAGAVQIFPVVAQVFPSFGWIYLILAPALGGLMVGGLRVLAQRWLGEIPEGIPAVIESVGQQGQGKLKGSSGAVLGLGTGLTIASGGSVGHEGPTVAIGATVGTVLARFFGLRLRRQTTMLGAGCAAGLAAAFNAPLAGVIFTVEVVFKRSVGGNVGSMSVFTPLIVAAVAGTFTSYAIFGERVELAPPGDVAGDSLLLEMVFFLALAVIAGLLSPLMSRVILFVSDLFERFEKLPQWVRPGLGGLGVGLMGTLLFTDLLGPGRGIIFSALNSELFWQMAIGLALLKILATALTIGSGGMGGVFMPSLVIGACVGTAVHALAELVLGAGVSQPAAYALVGMGAYLGATLRAPLTPIVMIFELTGDYGLILPLMFACILSAFVAGRVEPDTLFDLILRRKGSARILDAGDDAAVMHRGHVGDLMIQPDHMLRLDSSFDEVQRASLVEDNPTLYLLDEDDRVAAVLDSRRLAARALRGELDPSSSAGELALDERPTLLVADDTLAGAMLAFARSGRDVLPVVDSDRRLLGLLERADLMAHYSENVLEQQHAELQLHGGGGRGLDHEVDLGAGVTLERVVVGRNWAGRTLAELSLRQRVHVQVLEWQRDKQLLEVDPQAPLREGDVLALAGSRENLLAARWVE